jgi:hypothetical protein
MANKIQQTNRQENLKPGVFENNYARIQDLNKVVDEFNAEILAIDTDLNDGIFDVPLVSDGGNIEHHTTATAVNVTGAISAAGLATGYITSTSAAAVTATLPTATLLAAELGASAGTSFEFIVDNSGGANTVTVAVNTGITTATPVVTGGATLTVSNGTTVSVSSSLFSWTGYSF